MTLKNSILLALIFAAFSSFAFADTSSTNVPLSAAGTLANQQAQPRLRYRIVVDQDATQAIQYQQWNLPPEVGAGIQAQLVDKLQKSGYFIVLERQASATAQEANEDAIDATKRASLPEGSTVQPARQQRIAGGYVITPAVIGFAQTGGGNNGLSLGGISFGGKKSEISVTLNIRISDAQTSEMLESQTSVGKAEAKSNGVGLNLGGAGFSNDQFKASPAGQAVDQALDDAVKQIITRLSAEPWTAIVAAQDKTTHRVIINAGDLSGVAVGQQFDVFQAGAPVLDPDTGAVISTGDDVKVGRIRVQRVEHNASYCDVTDGTTFAVRDIVKPVK